MVSWGTLWHMIGLKQARGGCNYYHMADPATCKQVQRKEHECIPP